MITNKITNIKKKRLEKNPRALVFDGAVSEDYRYIPVAYRHSCTEMIFRHNPKATKEEIYSEYDRCMKLASQHNYPSKAILSAICYGYLCPEDINNEKK